MKIDFITYKEEYFERCAELFKSNCPPFFDSSEEKYFLNWLRALPKGEMCYPNILENHFYVGWGNKEIQTCGGFYLLDDNVTIRLSWGMVHRDMHGKGVGTELFKFRLREMSALYPHAILKMDTSQHTFPFYEKMGFDVVSIEENAYGPDLHKYEMSWKDKK